MDIAQGIERNKDERWLYEMREKGLKDIRSIEEYAQEIGLMQGREEGERIGLVKGEQIGLMKGERMGQEKGERLKAFETAKKMLLRNMDVAVIADLTGLSEADVLSLKD